MKEGEKGFDFVGVKTISINTFIDAENPEDEPKFSMNCELWYEENMAALKVSTTFTYNFYIKIDFQVRLRSKGFEIKEENIVDVIKEFEEQSYWIYSKVASTLSWVMEQLYNLPYVVQYGAFVENYKESMDALREKLGLLL